MSFGPIGGGVGAGGGGGGGSGDVDGPASATDTALARFSGTTGKVIQNGAATLSNGGNLVISASSGNTIQATAQSTGYAIHATATNNGYALGLFGDTTSPVNPPLFIDPQDAIPSGGNVVGDVQMGTGGRFRICTAAGTPGTWRTLGFIDEDVAAKTANYPVVAADSSVRFTNEGASGEVIFTLPSAVAGLTYVFLVQAAQNLRVTAATGDTIRVAGNVSAAAGNIVNATIGGSVKLTAINATEWFAEYSIGTWTVT